MRNNVWRPQFSTLHNLKCQASILADNDDDNNDDEDKDEDIYIMMKCLCVLRKMITFLKGLSVVSVFFQGRFMVFHGFGWSP